MSPTLSLPLPSPWGPHRPTSSRWHAAMLTGSLLAASLMVGCGEGSPDDTGSTSDDLEAGFEADLSAGSGCGDVVVYASNADDELALHFVSWEGLAEQAHADGAAVTRTWDLASEVPTELNVTAGTHLTHETCNDALEYTPVIDGTWVPVAGTLTLVVTPAGDPTDWGAFPADAVLTFEDVEWVPEDDASATPVPMGSLTLEAHVGWLPG
jgi:hypothetical protein